MANKQTKRERREQAKKARLEAQKRAARARRMRRIYSLGGAAVVIALIVFLIMNSQASNRRRVGDLNEALAAAGCAGQQAPAIEGREHVDAGTQVAYKTNPPTSGNHFGGVAGTGVLLSPPADGFLLHNMEHGHVILWFKESVAEPIRTALEEVARADAEWIIAVPRENMDAQVAFTAWGKISTCASPTDAAKVKTAAQRFIELNKDKAPESIPGQPGAPAPTQAPPAQPDPTAEAS